eukprot:PLAT16156.1.p1 GENE.PLAT16156.1~~PLAT16156.1.p1  ORF type:complete len:458 (-),score=148.25 PLAT16156.1:74-1423(-)
MAKPLLVELRVNPAAPGGYAERRRWFARTDGSDRVQARKPAASAPATFVQGVAGAARELFLPIGYPTSVRPEYLQFQAWDTLQALCSYLRGILTTQAILEGVGVGQETASPLAAAISWVLRDGAGLFGNLLFTWWGASRFDADVKRWRLFADVANDIGLTLELLAPRLPSLFMPLACAGTLFKTMCGVAAGGARASLTSHFAASDNIADVAAKEGSQETAVTLIGMLVGIQLSSAIGSSLPAVWSVFALLTAVHVLANYRAVACLRLRSLNAARLALLWQAAGDSSVEAVNAAEPIVAALFSSPFSAALPSAPALAAAVRFAKAPPPGMPAARLQEALRAAAGRDYALLPSCDRQSVSILLACADAPRDSREEALCQLRAWCAALVLLKRMRQGGSALPAAIVASMETAESAWQDGSPFRKALQAHGWLLQPRLCSPSVRFDWEAGKTQ